MDDITAKRLIGWILVLSITLAGIFTFVNYGSFKFFSKERTMEIEIQEKKAEPVTAFGGRLVLPISEYYFVINADGAPHYIKVSRSQYHACIKKAVFKIYYAEETGKISKIICKGPAKKRKT